MAIADEADSLLVDEARVPLVIAGSAEPAVVDPYRVRGIAGSLREAVDYRTDENGRLLAINLQPDVKGKYIRWDREGCSGPLAHGRGDVYVLEQDEGIVALHEKDGVTRWEKPLHVQADYYTLNGYSARSRRKRERDLSTIMAFGYKAGWIHAIKEKGEY